MSAVGTAVVHALVPGSVYIVHRGLGPYLDVQGD